MMRLHIMLTVARHQLINRDFQDRHKGSHFQSSLLRYIVVNSQLGPSIFCYIGKFRYIRICKISWGFKQYKSM